MEKIIIALIITNIGLLLLNFFLYRNYLKYFLQEIKIGIPIMVINFLLLLIISWNWKISLGIILFLLIGVLVNLAIIFVDYKKVSFIQQEDENDY